MQENLPMDTGVDDAKDTILLVDDQVDILTLLSLSLRRQGYEVLTASNGFAGLRSAKELAPDLVILDVMMPDMSGYQVCTALREDPATQNIPIIMLTALSDVPEKIKGLKAGADEYIAKPVDLAELGARIQGLLSRTRRLQRSAVGQPAKIIGCIGARGGVGTSTVALNMALALSEQSRRVLAVELSSWCGTFAQQFRLNPQQSLYHLMQLDLGSLDPRAVNERTYRMSNYLRLLFGPQSAEHWVEPKAEYVRALLDECTHDADYIVLDLPSLPTSFSRTALRMCNVMILVLEPEFTSAAAAKRLARLLALWKSSTAEILTVVNDRTGCPHPQSIDEVRGQLGYEVLGTIANDPALFADAFREGNPVLMFDEDSAAAKSFTRIGERLARRLVSGARP